MSFVHLHNHTHYSILEGLPKPKDYVKKVKEFGMPGVAITDTSNLHGCHELYKYAREEGINPILGTEIYLKSDLDKNMFHKIVLLAKNLNGYRNIITLTTISHLEQNDLVPYITFKDLKNYKEDIICLSGPLSSEISHFVLLGKTDEEIMSKINQYIEVFGDDFYVELLYHDDIPKQNLVTNKLIELHKKYNFKVVACQNTYYIDKKDSKTQDIIRALGTGHLIENPDRPTLINGDYSFLSEEKMQELFGFIPEALSNTLEINNKVNINIDTGGILIPVFELPLKDNEIFLKSQILQNENTKKLTSDEWYLRYLSFKGLNWRYKANLKEEDLFLLVEKKDIAGLGKKLTDTSPEELKELSQKYSTDEKIKLVQSLSKDIQDKIERLEYELVVVHEMGFDAYFLIVADYINWARDNDIPVGPGRGSAAGSLMAFLTGITDIDPLPYDLLFERFLNPARVSMPDIDTDFSDDGRDRVIKYCMEKYGKDRVAQICTFGTFAARARVKDVGRVMGISFSEMNELAKLIPEKPGTKLEQALNESLEFRKAYDSNPKYKDIIDNALKIEGNVRQVGVHACAVIIAPEKMTNFTRLSHPPKDKNAIITQYSAYPLEDLGLLKMDFLGLKNLTVIKRALKIIKNNKGIDIDISTINLNDKKVFEIFASGDTTGVFQFESDGMRKYLQDLKPDTFEDIIAMVSLYRPGPLAYIPDYIKRKHGTQEIVYLTDTLKEKLLSIYSKEEVEQEKQKLEQDLKKILDVTYGIAVYQEQLMFIVQYMAGFSLGEADLLRRGVGKKKIDIIEALKKEFITRREKYRGYKKETSQYIYEEMIQPARNYSFNKSHRACYALIAYQTAFLKAYYKTEFLTSLMVSDEENTERIVLEVAEAESNSIRVLPPSIVDSMKHFTYIDDNTIRFGLKAIKGIGDGPIEKIKEVRANGPFLDLKDFILRTKREVINKKTLEALILSGAMDIFGDRGILFYNIENMINFLKMNEKQKNTMQIGLFDDIKEQNDLNLETKNKFTYKEFLFGERQVLGFFVSGHPLDFLSKYISKRSKNEHVFKLSFEEIEKLQKKQKGGQIVVQSVGFLKDKRILTTKSGGNMMFLYLESFYYDFEATIFSKDFDKYKGIIKDDSILVISGILNLNPEYKKKGITVYDIKVLDLDQVYSQATDLGLLDNVRYNVFLKNNIISKNKNNIDLQQESKDKQLQIDELKECEENCFLKNKHDIQIKDYIVNIPNTASKKDLLDFKNFLSKEQKGNIKIYINFKGQKIYTKINLKNIETLQKWEKEKFEKK